MTAGSLATVVGGSRPTTVAGVLHHLEALDGSVPADSGVAAFNRLYWWTTQRVDAAITQGRFEDGPAMARLDVTFADLYFDAVSAWATGGKPPGAWRPLFHLSGEQGIPPLHFALAGMHAHINRDLAVALAGSSEGPLLEGTPQYRDYLLINRILGETSDQIRERILPPVLVGADRAFGEVDDQLVLRAIITARRAAWEVGERLHEVIGVAPLFAAALRVLDVTVGATARAILEPEGVIGA